MTEAFEIKFNFVNARTCLLSLSLLLSLRKGLKKADTRCKSSYYYVLLNGIM